MGHIYKTDKASNDEVNFDQKLHYDLFKDYEPSALPNNGQTSVGMSFILDRV